jgi:hypothetical protein
MRVYEFAKEAGVTSAAVLKAAEAAGVEVSSAISVIDESETGALKAAVGKLQKTSPDAARAAKLEKARRHRAAALDADRAALEKHLSVARAAAEGKAVDTRCAPPPKPAPEKAAAAAKDVRGAAMGEGKAPVQKHREEDLNGKPEASGQNAGIVPGGHG